MGRQFTAWLGAGAVGVGTWAALTVGAGIAAADSDTGSDSSGSSSSESSKSADREASSRKSTAPRSSASTTASNSKRGTRSQATVAERQRAENDAAPDEVAVIKRNTSTGTSPARRTAAEARAEEPSTPSTPAPAVAETAFDAPAAFSAPPPLPSIVDVIGSVALAVIGAAIRIFDGPPVVPPWRNVTVRTSTLQVGDQTVRADWYFPDGDDPPAGIIHLQHGLLATGPMYSLTAAYLAEKTNSIVVAPTLTSNMFAFGGFDGAWLGGEAMREAVTDLYLDDERVALTASAIRAGYADFYDTVALPTEFVLMGHSLGGGLVGGVAGQYAQAVRLTGRENHLRGVILLDAVPLGGFFSEAMDRLNEFDDDPDADDYIPVYAIGAELNFLNTSSEVNTVLAQKRPGSAGHFTGVVLRGGSHMDGMLGANPLIQLAAYVVAGFPQPQNPAAVRDLSAGWITDMFGTCAQDRCGIYPEAGATTVTFPVHHGKWTAVGNVIGGPVANNRSRGSGPLLFLPQPVNALPATRGLQVAV